VIYRPPRAEQINLLRKWVKIFMSDGEGNQALFEEVVWCLGAPSVSISRASGVSRG